MAGAALEKISIPAKQLHQVHEEEMQTIPVICHVSFPKLLGQLRSKKAFWCMR